MVFPPEAPPTDFGPDHDAELELFAERMTDIQTFLRNANAAQGTRFEISVLLFDSERFLTKTKDDPDYEVWNNSMTAKYNAFYDLGRLFFPTATIDWFQRGQPTKRWFTLDEQGDTFNCSLIRIPDEEFSREIFLGTLATALSNGHGTVTIWADLACGLPEGAREFDRDWNYPREYSYRLGARINDPNFVDPLGPGAPWSSVHFVSFWPRPFSDDTPHWGRHFVSYVRGAHGLPD
jgi:hypothetical protein